MVQVKRIISVNYLNDKRDIEEKINDFLCEMSLSKEDIVYIHMDFGDKGVDYVVTYIFYEDRKCLD